MTKNNLINSPEDVFYFTLDELEKYCYTSENYEEINLINLRKNEFAKFAQHNLPDRIVYNGDTPPIDIPSDSIFFNKNIISGTGISKGHLTAEAIVLSNPDYKSNVDGKILVSRMTDPAWVFLMIRAVGLISEKGSPLSHTAIVGRELGIPVIIGVNNAT